MRLVYLIGEPGCGKSAAVRHALPELANDFGHEYPGFEAWAGSVKDIDVWYLGNPRHVAFPGTDRLSMSVQPLVLDWLTENAHQPWLVVGEGDRLATLSFLAGAHEAGVQVTVVNCYTHLAEIRRSARARRLHLREQKASWVKGRQTKLTRLVVALAAAGVPTVPLNTTATGEWVGRELRRVILPG